MSLKIERLGSVRNGRPVVAIDPELLDRLEAEDGDEIVTPKEGGASTGKLDDAPSITRATDEKIVKPKL